jgi:hypothetical protein
MEQRLDATYLRPGLVERAAAIGIGAVAIGTSILLATWGISLLRPGKPSDPIVRQVEREQPKPVEVIVKVDQLAPAVTNGSGSERKTATGDVITRAVTVFYEVNHGVGQVVTGWNYKDGSGRTPVGKYCYYTAPNPDRTSTKVDIGFDGRPLPHISASLVPDLEGALAKCQWKA